METQPNRIIAERTLTFARNSDSHLVVRLEAPEMNVASGDYLCRYHISGTDIEISKYAAGLDAFQALQLAFIAIGANLVYLEQQTEDTLRWSDVGLGFPRP